MTLLAEAHALGVADRVRITGYVPDEDLPPTSWRPTSACASAGPPAGRPPRCGSAPSPPAGRPSSPISPTRPTCPRWIRARGVRWERRTAREREVDANFRPVSVAIDLLDEDDSLARAMTRLATDAALREELGRNAREFWQHPPHDGLRGRGLRGADRTGAGTPGSRGPPFASAPPRRPHGTGARDHLGHRHRHGLIPASVDPISSKREPCFRRVVVEHLHRSSEYSSRSLPTSDSFFRMSLVTVMMWQPIASAWKMFSSSRGLAQISSAFGRGLQHLDGGGHQRHRVAPGVGDAAGEDRDVRTARRRSSASATSRTCSSVIIAVTFSLTPACDSRRTRSYGGSPLRVGDRDLHVDVARPSVAISRAWRSISANSSENTSNEIGRSGIAAQDLAGEGRVVGDAGLAHQRRVGGEALDVAASRYISSMPSMSAPSAKILTFRSSTRFMLASSRGAPTRIQSAASRQRADT